MEFSYSMKGEKRQRDFPKSCSLSKKSIDVIVPSDKALLKSFWYNEINDPKTLISTFYYDIEPS